LFKGIWRRPKSSTPDQGGNTVLVAHRFLYTFGPNTFYNLDKVKVHDHFSVVWKKQRYYYEVTEIETVLPTDVTVEAQGPEPVVTLWTCTPVFIANKRLVVVGKLIPNANKTQN